MADLTGLGSLFDFGGKVIDKLWPNKDDAEKAKLELFKLQQSGELQLMAGLQASDAGQVEVNKIEAASNDLFRGGWRPAAGWVCVLGLFYALIIQPVLSWASVNFAWQSPPPIELEPLLALLFGMLGLGYYRTRERLGK